MAEITTVIQKTINLDKAPVESEFPSLIVGESGGKSLLLTCIRDSGDADITGATCAAIFLNSLEQTITLTGEVASNAIRIVLDKDCSATAGKLSAIVFLTLGDVTNAVYCGHSYVHPGATDTIIDPNNVVPSLSELLAQIADCKDATAAALAAAALANAAADGAAAGADAAAAAAAEAEDAAALAEAAAAQIDGMTAEADGLPEGSAPTIAISMVDGAKHISLGIPAGQTGSKGERGTRRTHGTAITGTNTTPAIYATGIPDALSGDEYAYNGTNDADIGNIYVCVLAGDETTALWKYTQNNRGPAGSGDVNSVDSVAPISGDVPLTAVRYGTTQVLTVAQMLQVLANIGAIARMTALPAAAAAMDGLIVQFVGVTNATFTNGYFYRCASDGGSGYQWTFAAVGAYATAAQGAKADSALQPGDVVNSLESLLTSVPLSAAQGKVLQDSKAEADAIAALTSGGVVSGGVVSAQAAPDQTVAVTACEIVTPAGKNYSIAANTALAADAADATNPRIDIVYITPAGELTYLAGTAAASPTQPATPTNGTLLAVITRAADDNAIAAAAIADQRTIIVPLENKANEPDLLWENASPTSTFPAQTISLNLTGYSYIRVDVRARNDIAAITSSFIKSSGAERIPISGAPLNGHRVFNTAETGVTCDTAYTYATYGSDAITGNASYAIPVRIFGYK